MIKYNREIEKKFVIQSKDLPTLLKPEISEDIFWKAPHVDFIRYRENTRELTVKFSDLGVVTDRIEENVIIEKDSVESLKRLLTLLHGPACKKLTKIFKVRKYHISPAPGVEYTVHVSRYKVLEDVKCREFLEVESSSMEAVDYFVKTELSQLHLVQENRSLFQIFMEER